MLISDGRTVEMQIKFLHAEAIDTLPPIFFQHDASQFCTVTIPWRSYLYFLCQIYKQRSSCTSNTLDIIQLQIEDTCCQVGIHMKLICSSQKCSFWISISLIYEQIRLFPWSISSPCLLLL